MHPRIVALGDVAETRLGKMLDTQKNTGDLNPYLRNPNVRWFDVDLSDLKYMRFESDELDKYSVEPGDVLVCEGGEAGRAAVWPENAPRVRFQKAIHRVRTGPRLFNRYLVHRLMYDYFRGALNDYYTGATIKHLTGQDLRRYRFALPPLPEQRRIAAILDQADALRTKARVALRRLHELPAALFSEMFGSPIRNEKHWQKIRLGEITTKIGSGATPTGGEASYKSSGISLIRSMNVHDGEFEPRGLAHIDSSQAAKLENVVVEANDVLLNITGASVARVCRVPASVIPARVNQHVSIIRPRKFLNPVFLEFALLHPDSKAALLKIGESGATRQAITKAQIEQFELVIPDFELQSAYASRVETVDQLRECAEERCTTLDELFAGLQRALLESGNSSVSPTSNARQAAE